MNVSRSNDNAQFFTIQNRKENDQNQQPKKVQGKEKDWVQARGYEIAEQNYHKYKLDKQTGKLVMIHPQLTQSNGVQVCCSKCNSKYQHKKPDPYF